MARKGIRRGWALLTGKNRQGRLSPEGRARYLHRVSDHVATMLTLVALGQYPWTVTTLGGGIVSHVAAFGTFLLLEGVAGRVMLEGAVRQEESRSW